ncbi:hypothetical protein N5923_00555 [Erwiniaceae bacterium BAC15a-03b]|uniref:Uncharacterized protein n=1 Tax=Winslowiella arboricola TaxID=2978220 RepID=A0A9J6PMX7_9GAMM|nr:hypothetical protein [Winslowiella arboricola]MCU5771989.1 hypothetical protein [Winslowiella arboricola]MCU5775988.1 hypothetical protein [Winslowiella arboricola]
MRTLIPCNNLQDDVDPLILKEIIQQNIPKIEPQLVGDLAWYSQNARFVPGSVKIISIAPAGTLRYKMSYQFEWMIFNACLDIDASETAVETVQFQIIPGFLAFELIDNQYPSTANEL